MKNRSLSFFESMMLVAGAGIGTGILTIPYAVEKVGIPGTVIALIFAYLFSAVLYLMIGELTRNSKQSEELIGILKEHLFGNDRKKILQTLFFLLLILLLLENLVVYLLCASNVLQTALGWPAFLCMGLFYAAATVVGFFGMKAIGIGEKISVLFIGVTVVALSVVSFLFPRNSVSFSLGEPQLIFALYGLFMFAFSAIFSVIQVTNHIKRPELTKPAILAGLTLNALLTVIFAVASIVGSGKVTEIATVGISDSLGPVASWICTVLVAFAMLTSFWSSGFAFADVIGEQLHLSSRISWFIGTVPALIIALILPLSVLDYIQIGAGALSVILVITVLPAYRNAIRVSTQKPYLGRVAKSPVLLIVLGVAILLMAVSSFISFS